MSNINSTSQSQTPLASIRYRFVVQHVAHQAVQQVHDILSCDRTLYSSLLYNRLSTEADLAQGIFKEILELNKRGGPWDGSLPAGSRGGAPVGGLGHEVPQKRKHIVVYCNKF